LKDRKKAGAVDDDDVVATKSSEVAVVSNGQNQDSQPFDYGGARDVHEDDLLKELMTVSFQG